MMKKDDDANDVDDSIKWTSIKTRHIVNVNWINLIFSGLIINQSIFWSLGGFDVILI